MLFFVIFVMPTIGLIMYFHRLRNITLTLFVAFLVVNISGCAVNPVTGKSELSWISEAEEIQMGEQQYLPSQQSQGGIYLADPAVIRYVNEVGQRVAGSSSRSLPFEFVVLNSSVPNAWALPGGKIAVNRGLLLELSNEAELAAVLGHEAVHSAARHGANSSQRNTIVQGLVLAAAIGASAADLDAYSDYIVGGAEVVTQLITQKYSRKAELEADYYGIKYMSLAGYDPRAAISLQKTFVKLSGDNPSSGIDGWFASHPPSMDRVHANEATVESLELPAGEFNRSRYQEMMAYLVKTKPAYDEFDDAIALAAADDLDQALATLNKAIDAVPTEARFLGLQGDIYYQKGRYPAANRSYTDAMALDKNYYEYHLGRGLTHKKQGNMESARRDLQRSNSLLPTAIANHTLGQLSLLANDKSTAKRYFRTAMSANSNVGAQARLAFSQLDLPDNPGRYINVVPSLDASGILGATIENSSAFNVKNAEIEFAAIVDQVLLKRVIKVSYLPANQTLRVSTDWLIKPTDSFKYVKVIRAHL